MAQPLVCQLCEEEPGALVVTLAADGTTVICGPTCLPAFCAGLVEALCGIVLAPVAGDLSAEAGAGGGDASPNTAPADVEPKSDGAAPDEAPPAKGRKRGTEPAAPQPG